MIAKHRMTLDLNERSYAAVESIRDSIGSTSKAAVLRESLRLFEWCIDVESRGGKIYAELDGERERKPIRGTF